MYNPGQEISSIDFGAIIGGSLNAVVAAQSQSANTTVDFIKRVGFEKKITENGAGQPTETEVPINVAFTYDKEVSPAQFISKNEWSVEVVDGGKGYSNDAKKYTLKVEDTTLTVEKVELNEDTSIKSIAIKALPDDVSLNDGADITIKYEDEVSNVAALKLKLTQKYEEVPALIQKMQIQVPLLTMVPIPFIKIENADIDFNVKINSVSSQSSDSVTNTKVNSDFRYGFFARASINASVSNQSSRSSSEEVKKDYSLNIKVHAVQDDMPAGVSRILDMLEDSIIARPMNEPVQAEKTPDSSKTA